MPFKRVDIFLLIFQLVHFDFSLALLGLFGKALVISQVWLFVGFHHLEQAVAVQLFGLLFCFCWCSSYFRFAFFFPEIMVFVVFELFHEKLASFAFCHATRPPFTRTCVK